MVPGVVDDQPGRRWALETTTLNRYASPGVRYGERKVGGGGEGVCESFKPNPYVGRVDRGLVRDERTGGLAQGRDKTR